jgi:hypothetical protein
MRFRIGGVFAKCYGCGHEDFFPALALSSGRRDVFICAHCGNESYYSELVRRAGGQAEAEPPSGSNP